MADDVPGAMICEPFMNAAVAMAPVAVGAVPDTVTSVAVPAVVNVKSRTTCVDVCEHTSSICRLPPTRSGTMPITECDAGSQAPLLICENFFATSAAPFVAIQPSLHVH